MKATKTIGRLIVGCVFACCLTSKLHAQMLPPPITVRVLKGMSAEISSVYRPLVHELGCERLEVFMRFSPSTSFAKLPGCMPEN